MSKVPNIPYAELRQHFPLKAIVKKPALYESIGHPEKIPDANWDNTCAVRLSIALVGVGVPIAPGYLTIETGPHKGKRIESRQKTLSEFLRKRWGEPEKYAGGPAARKGIGRRQGVISFFQLYGPSDRQGHIDLVGPDSWDEPMCADDCYWSSVEVWFWPLK
jgi:hypothetical protein